MRAFFKRRCTPARLMTNASPMTDVAVVAGRQAGRRRRRLQLFATSRRLHEKPEARNTHSAPIAVHFYVYGKWLLVFVVVVIVVAGTTNCIWLCASLASSDCSRPFSILTINYQKNKEKKSGRQGRLQHPTMTQ